MAAMKIGVTGAGGHLGNVICRFLLDRGHEVRGLVRNHSPALGGLSVEIFQGDMLDEATTLAFTTGLEAVIHAGALVSIGHSPAPLVLETNAKGTAQVISACLKKKVGRLVYVSSAHAVSEEPRGEPLDEGRPYKGPGAPAYDYSKALAEQAVLAAVKNEGLDAVVVRPSSVLGPFDFKPSPLGKALLDLRTGRIPVLPQGGYDFVDVRDVCQSIVVALEKGGRGEIYQLSGKYHSLVELGALMEKTTGVPAPRLVLPTWFLIMALPLVKLLAFLRRAAPSFTFDSVMALKRGHPNLRNDKARAQLGHKARPLKDTLRDFYLWVDKKEVSL